MEVKKDVHEIIQKSKSIIILVSRPLDHDGITSAIVLRNYLKKKKKFVDVYSTRKITSKFLSLPYIEVVKVKDPRKMNLLEYDLVIALDGGNKRQFSCVEKDDEFNFSGNPNVLNIDHHLTNTHFASFEIWDPKASSTAQVLINSIIDIERIDEDDATLLYIGIVGDTGNFRYSFNGLTLEIASKLVKRGADYLYAVNMYMNNYNKVDFEIYAYLIKSTVYKLKLGYCYVIADYEKISVKFNCLIENIKDSIYLYETCFACAVKGIKFSLVLTRDREMINVSMRGNSLNNKIPLPEIGCEFDKSSGGHFNSSGFRIKGEINTVLQNLDKVIKEFKLKYES